MANKDHIRRWVMALRSGKYEQTTGALRKGDAYCCLGVACEVSGVGEWRGSTTADLLPAYGNDDYRESGILPTPVINWLGLDDGDPMLVNPERGGSTRASEWNDEHGATFEEIADFIEATFLDGEN
jgi:hypothetical protein